MRRWWRRASAVAGAIARGVGRGEKNPKLVERARRGKRANARRWKNARGDRGAIAHAPTISCIVCWMNSSNESSCCRARPFSSKKELITVHASSCPISSSPSRSSIGSAESYSASMVTERDPRGVVPEWGSGCETRARSRPGSDSHESAPARDRSRGGPPRSPAGSAGARAWQWRRDASAEKNLRYHSSLAWRRRSETTGANNTRRRNARPRHSRRSRSRARDGAREAQDARRGRSSPGVPLAEEAPRREG